ncbi:YybS family protein [Ornithinibacillus halotolerans]|uniref:Membrane protein n=1 Tax=Ornithinibacillus halotolerans TaxID=1274357 RepID=A0A916RTD7_9BACI|nr:DUF2232 domain-containing protein [Ornithinibacillus halotolerans]GGA70264.1 membrane protein [Ornithinibacillus halotolerans]
MNISKQLKDGALLTVIFLVLLILTMIVPLLAFIIAVPFIIFAARHSILPSIIMFVAASLLSILFATLISLPFVILAGISGIMIGIAINQERTPYETWARGTIGFAVGITMAILFTLLVFDINILSEFNQQLDETLETSQEIAMELGLGNLTEDQISVVEQQLELYKQLVPVAIVIISLVLSFLSQWISYKILNRFDKKQLRFPKFRNLRFPTVLIWIYLLAIVISLFQNDPTSPVFTAIQNVLMLTGLFVVLQGLSFIFFFAHRKKLSIAIPIIIIVVALLFAPLLLPLVRILGIIDLGFGLRDRMVK